MSRGAILTGAVLALSFSAWEPAASVRDLSFEQRVEAQRAIERVYYSHLTGARRTFEQAVTPELLERKVRAYLKQSAALEQYWNTPITAAMLRAEAERIARGSQFPERLAEIDAALGHDALLIQETLVRATLAERLSRNFFAYDERIHGVGRAEIDRIRGQLLYGALDAGADHPRRRVVQEPVTSETSVSTGAVSPRVDRVEGAEEESEDPFEPAASEPVEIGPVQDDPGGYSVRVPLPSTPGWIAVYAVPKLTWEDWWAREAAGFDETQVPGVADSTSTALSRAASSATETCPLDDTWDNGVLDDMPDPRREHAAVWTGTEMIVWGGRTDAIGSGESLVSNAGRYDPLTDTWRPVSLTGAPQLSSPAVSVWTGAEMIVLGGANGGRYDPVSDTWSSISAVGEPPRAFGQTAVWTGREMIVWGPSQGARYDPSTDSWRPMSSTDAPSARQRHTAVWTGNVMIVWGGEEGFFDTLVGTGARYDPVTDTWTPTSAADAPLPRVEHTAVWTGTKMIIWGGLAQADQFTKQVTSSGARYDPVTNTWTPTSIVGFPSPRRAHTAVWAGSRMIVWGGSSDPSRLSSTDIRPVLYDPSADTWQTGSQVNAPFPSPVFHTAVWTGSLMIGWGGQASSNGTTDAGGRYDPERDAWSPTTRSPGGTVVSPQSPAVWTGNEMLAWTGELSGMSIGGRYDPMLDAWRPISASGSPAARFDHVAVWTEDEMVVWGGYVDWPIPTSTGGRYDPINDSWRPTSLVGAPEARAVATAVWTEREMIVWGGWAGRTLGTGGRYDPSTDTWRATALLNLPGLFHWSAFFHTAVWTGREMIIWGGQACDRFCSDFFASGARYDPGRDLWSALPDLPTEQRRAGHTAVWTGREMIVFGGSKSFLPPQGPQFHPAWLYDRASDSWSAIPMPHPSLPEGGNRIGHTAVWTGRHMLIWGGSFSSIGAVYDHTAETWRAMSFDRAPHRRQRHTAVWTGRELIVWGGQEQSAFLWNGGRYTFGQHSDDDGDGLSECGGDCNDADASAWPGAPEMCNGRDDSCDGVADEDSAGLDTDEDGTANACDTCPDLANPGQSSPFACIAAEQDGGQCLRAEMEVAALVGEGSVTIVGERAAPPDTIELEFRVTSCFGVQPIDVFLNGELLVSFTEPMQSCACDVPVYRVAVSDQTLLGSLWQTDGQNVLEVRKPPFDFDQFAGTGVAWVAARIGSGREQSSERVCLFDRLAEDCSEGSLCPQAFYWLDALDETVPVVAQPREEVAHSSAAFTGPELPGLIDLASVPDGPVQLCVGPDGPPRLYAADGAGRIYVVDPAGASSTPAGSLPGAVLEIAHDDVGRKTWAQSAAPGGDALEEVDLVGGNSVATSPFLGLPLSGLEFLSPALYGVEVGGVPFSKPNARLMEIDPQSGFSRIVDILPFGTWDGLTYDEAARQFLSVLVPPGAGAELWSVDPATGEGRMLHALAFEPSALEFGPDGALYAARRIGGDTELHRLDPATGATTLVGPMGVPDVISLTTVRKHPRACLDIVKQGEQTLAINRSCNSSPTALAGSDQVAECSSVEGAGVTLDGTGSSDPDSTTLQDDIALYEWIADHGLPTERLLGTGGSLIVTLPLGQHAVTLRVTDRAGATGLDDLLVNVVDTTPPSMSVVADPVELWPPNHRMVPVTLAVTAHDACDAEPRVELESVTSNETDDEPGNADGHTVEDIQAGAVGASTSELLLRAERDGSGAGRLYAIRFTALDASGNPASGGAGVMVPHDQGGITEPVLLDVMTQAGQGAPRTSLSWTPVASASHYNVLRGAISGLSRLGSFTLVAGAACLARELETTQFAGDPIQQAPPLGEAFLYLVEYFDGRHSGYGTATGQGEIAVVSGDSCH